MKALAQDQEDLFWRDGVLLVEEAVTPEELANLRAVFAHWVEESRAHDADFGETLDGRARFDLEPGHSAETPALRRVQSPEEISDVYADVMRNARTVDFVADLIGPAIKFPSRQGQFEAAGGGDQSEVPSGLSLPAHDE